VSVDLLLGLKSFLEKIPERPLISASEFCSAVCGFEVMPFHGAWLKFQLDNSRTLILAPRGHGKSTICTVAYSLFSLLNNCNLRVLIVSNTKSQSYGFLSQIRVHLESNPKLLQLYGPQRGEPWSQGRLSLSRKSLRSKEANITAMGVCGPIISKHYDIIILDDVVDEQIARSQGMREKLLVWFYKTLMPCLEPEGALHILGTRYHFLDLYGHLLTHDFKENFLAFRALNETAQGVVALWPEKFPVELLEQKRRDSGPAIFNSQYQNDVEMMKGSIFKQEWLRFYDRAPHALQIIIGVDLAISTRTTADYFALVVAGRDSRSGSIYLLREFRDRISFSSQVRMVCEQYRAWTPRPLRVVVEANGYQEAFCQKLREKGLPVKSVTRVRDKITRAYHLQARVESGELLFPRSGCADLIEELVLFPQASHDDLFDALELVVAQFKLAESYTWMKKQIAHDPA